MRVIPEICLSSYETRFKVVQMEVFNDLDWLYSPCTVGIKVVRMSFAILDGKISEHNRCRFSIKSAKCDAGVQLTKVNFHLKEQIYNILTYNY